MRSIEDKKVDKSKKDYLHEASDKLNYFNWEMDFADVLDTAEARDKGFDIVIGNPPYVQMQKMGAQIALFQKKATSFDTFSKSGDLYMLFYEIGVDILKPGGVETYITSNKWIRTKYGTKLRKFFAEKTNPVKLVDFGQSLVFENAIVHSNVLMVKKEKYRGKLPACRFSEDYRKGSRIDEYFEKNHVNITSISDESWMILPKNIADIQSHIEEIGVPLKDWNLSTM